MAREQHHAESREDLGALFAPAVATFAIGTDALVVAGPIPRSRALSDRRGDRRPTPHIPRARAVDIFRLEHI